MSAVEDVKMLILLCGYERKQGGDLLGGGAQAMRRRQRAARSVLRDGDDEGGSGIRTMMMREGVELEQ